MATKNPPDGLPDWVHDHAPEGIGPVCCRCKRARAAHVGLLSRWAWKVSHW